MQPYKEQDSIVGPNTAASDRGIITTIDGSGFKTNRNTLSKELDGQVQFSKSRNGLNLEKY